MFVRAFQKSQQQVEQPGSCPHNLSGPACVFLPIPRHQQCGHSPGTALRVLRFAERLGLGGGGHPAEPRTELGSCSLWRCQQLQRVPGGSNGG